MIALPRALAPIAFAVLAGVAIVEARFAARYQRTVAAQATAAAALERRIRQSRGETAQDLEFVQSIRDAPPESVAPANAADPADPAEVARWLRKVKQLKQIFADQPAQSLPQLDLLTAQDWVAAARAANLETEDGIERALAQTRVQAKERFTSLLFSALQSYLAENKGELPAKLNELLPYLDESARDPAMLDRYELTASGKLRDAPKSAEIVREKAIVNAQLENHVEIIHAGNGSLTFMNSIPHPDSIDLNEEFELYLLHAARAFAAANGGAMPSSPEQLTPYYEPPLGRLARSLTFRTTPPEEREAYQKSIAEALAKKR